MCVCNLFIGNSNSPITPNNIERGIYVALVDIIENLTHIFAGNKGLGHKQPFLYCVIQLLPLVMHVSFPFIHS